MKLNGKLSYLILPLFVLAACTQKEKATIVSVSNASDFDRNNEIVEVDKEKITVALQLNDDETFVILDADGTQVPYQILTDGNTVIFLASAKAKTTTEYKVEKGTPEEFEALVYGRLIPERKDDFIWENNKAGYRLYGPKIEQLGELISNGIDFFAKKTDKIVIDQWYADALAKKSSFHEDNGEGLDYFMVGRTLGMGAAAPFIDEKLVLGNNFTDYKIIENGPLRFQAEFRYAPFSIGENDVTETRTVTFDAYNQLNKIVEHFEGPQQQFPLAFGLITRDEENKIMYASNEEGIIAYAEPEDPKNGITYSGVVFPKALSETKVSENHLLAITDYQSGGVTYYSGGGWSKGGFDSFDAWKACLTELKHTITNPLKVEIK